MDERNPEERITEEFFQFCETNHSVIVAAVARSMEAFFEKEGLEMMKPKFLAGEQEHGAMTISRLCSMDWRNFLWEEFIDAYFYTAMQMKQELMACTPKCLEER